MRLKFFQFTFHLSLLCACHATKPPEISVPEDYLPLVQGRFSEMEQSRTTYSPTAAPYHEKQLTRCEITGISQDATGQSLCQTDYYHLLDDRSWNADSTTLFWQSGNEVIGLEAGSPVVQLVSPATVRNVWDGNAYNNKGARLFRIKDIGKPFQAGGQRFPETVTVVRQLDSTLLSLKKHILVYANHIGLIYEEKQFVHYCYQADCVGKGIVQSGYQQKNVIKNYGVK